MTDAVQQFLHSFDSLSLGEQRAAALEVLKRTLDSAPGEVSDEALVQIADELFLSLDEAEQANGED